LDKLKDKPLAKIRADAIADLQKYLNRVQFDIGKTSDDILSLPTKDRLQRIKEGHHGDPDLMETYFQFGRYLLIASSRPGCLPANLQGKWNPYARPPWASDYHLNINIQMNYWLAETCNLAESKVDLLVFLSEKLDKFTQQGDIVDLQHAVLRFDQDTLRMTMGRHATAHASTQEQL
jgi:alpha-L-fucosidase 2